MKLLDWYTVQNWTREKWNNYFDKVVLDHDMDELKNYYDKMDNRSNALLESRLFLKSSVESAPEIMQVISDNDYVWAVAKGLLTYKRIDIIFQLLHNINYSRVGFEEIFDYGGYCTGLLYDPRNFGMEDVDNIVSISGRNHHDDNVTGFLQILFWNGSCDKCVNFLQGDVYRALESGKLSNMRFHIRDRLSKSILYVLEYFSKYRQESLQSVTVLPPVLFPLILGY